MKNKIVTIILCLLVLGMGSYIAYDKLVKNDKKDESVSSNDSNENLNEVATTLKNIVEESDVFKIIGSKYTEVSFTKEAFENNKNYILTNAILKVEYDKNSSLSADETTGIFATESEILEYTNKYFSVNSINFKDLKLDGYEDELGIYFKYDSSKKAYVEYKDDDEKEIMEFYGYFGQTPIYNKVDSIEENNGEYTLTLVSFFGNYRDCDFDSLDKNCSIKLGTELDYTSALGEDGGYDETKLAKLYDEYYENNKNNIPVKYQFTFKKNTDGTFYLTNFKEVK
jgi:hypothetical protein